MNTVLAVASAWAALDLLIIVGWNRAKTAARNQSRRVK